MSYDLQITFKRGDKKRIIDALKKADLNLDVMSMTAPERQVAVAEMWPKESARDRWTSFLMRIAAFVIGDSTEFTSREHPFQIGVYSGEASLSINFGQDLDTARRAVDAAWSCLSVMNQAARIKVYDRQSERILNVETDLDSFWETYRVCADQINTAMARMDSRGKSL